MSDVPRRIDVNRMSPGELAIRNAMIAVEQMGAHELLTDAILLLADAQFKVADYVDLKEKEK